MFVSSSVQVRFVGRILLALLSVLPVASFMFMMAPAYAQASSIGNTSTSELIALTNQDRASAGLGVVTENATLDQAAALKAADMAAKGYFAHTSPGGQTSWTWFQDVGYVYSYAGENLAEGFYSSDEVNTAWLNSPEHRANIMKPQYTEIGMAVSEGMYQGHDVIFVVQMFGTPTRAYTNVSITKPNTQKLAVATQPVVVGGITDVVKPATSVLGTQSAAPSAAAMTRAQTLSLIAQLLAEIQTLRAELAVLQSHPTA